MRNDHLALSTWNQRDIAVSAWPSHGGNTGSNPVCATKLSFDNPILIAAADDTVALQLTRRSRAPERLLSHADDHRRAREDAAGSMCYRRRRRIYYGDA